MNLHACFQEPFFEILLHIGVPDVQGRVVARLGRRVQATCQSPPASCLGVQVVVVKQFNERRLGEALHRSMNA